MMASRGKKIVVFLDYNGTLSPIVPDPDHAYMCDEMRQAVKDVAKCLPTSIISGRSREKVYSFVKLNEVYYSGSHRLDTKLPASKSKSYNDKYHFEMVDDEGNEFVIFQPTIEYREPILNMKKELEDRIEHIKEVKIEDNQFCLSVHYRHVDDEAYGRLEDLVNDVLQRFQDFRMTHEKKVMEIRPPVKFKKGQAMVHLLEHLGYVEHDQVLPIYIGDDKMDEDAFKVLNERGVGCSILVSAKPKKKIASYSLHDPSEVLAFLKLLSRWAGLKSNF